MDKKDSWGLTEEEIQERLRKLCVSTGTVPIDNKPKEPGVNENRPY